MLPSLATLRRQSLHGLTLAAMLTGTLAPAVPLATSWWSEGSPPPLAPNSATGTENNHSVANIGQAKWMAKSALNSLRQIWPAVADDIEGDLVGVGKPIASWAAPVTQEEKDKQRAPLLIGQLKAISAPFYERLHTRAPLWLDGERAAYGITSPGSYFPWSTSTADDQNHAVATIGQLKVVFSLDFPADRETGGAADGLPDLWEYRFFGNLTANATGDPDLDALSNLQEYLAGSDPTVGDTTVDSDGDGIPNMTELVNLTNPLDADTDGDGLPDGSDPSPLTAAFLPLAAATDLKVWSPTE